MSRQDHIFKGADGNFHFIDWAGQGHWHIFPMQLDYVPVLIRPWLQG
jgi:hypothetical protein